MLPRGRCPWDERKGSRTGGRNRGTPSTPFVPWPELHHFAETPPAPQGGPAPPIPAPQCELFLLVLMTHGFHCKQQPVPSNQHHFPQNSPSVSGFLWRRLFSYCFDLCVTHDKLHSFSTFEPAGVDVD